MVNLYNKDCLEVLKGIKKESVDLIVTDPPYKVTKKGCAGNSGGMMITKKTMEGNIFKHNDIDIEDYARELYRILKDGSHCYIMTNHVNLIRFLNVLTNDMRTEEERNKRVQPYSFHFIKNIIWDKGNKIMGRFYMSQFEYIIFLRKGKGVKINNCGTSDILSVPNIKTKNENGKNIHDTEKPIELMKILVENSSKENEVVMDCFMGVGSVGIACKQTNRNFIGVELDQEYFDIAKERIANEVYEKTTLF